MKDVHHLIWKNFKKNIYPNASIPEPIVELIIDAATKTKEFLPSNQLDEFDVDTAYLRRLIGSDPTIEHIELWRFSFKNS